jgi:hypothetical protein
LFCSNIFERLCTRQKVIASLTMPRQKGFGRKFKNSTGGRKTTDINRIRVLPGSSEGEEPSDRNNSTRLAAAPASHQKIVPSLPPRMTNKLASPLAISAPLIADTSSAPPRLKNPAIIRFDEIPPPVAVHVNAFSKNRGLTIQRGVTDKLASPPLAILTQAAATSSPPPIVNHPRKSNSVTIQFDDMPPPVPVNVQAFSKKNGSTIQRGVTDKFASPPLAISTQAAGTSSPPAIVNNPRRLNSVTIQFNDMPPPVPVNVHAFSEKKGSTILRSVVAARRAKSRAVQKIVAAVKSVGTKEQQALALKDAACHPELQSIAKSAGFAAAAAYFSAEFKVCQMEKMVRRAVSTKTKEGRPNDDKASFVESLLTSIVESPNTAIKPPSMRAQSSALGIPWSTGRRLLKNAEAKRILLMNMETGVDWSQRRKRKR